MTPAPPTSTAMFLKLVFLLTAMPAHFAAAEPAGSLAPLAARFVETRHQPDEAFPASDWFFTRSETRVESARRDYAEIWERDERGEIALTRVFHGDRKLIAYTPNELRARRRDREWPVLSTILDERTLARLKRTGDATVMGQPAVRYAGHLGDERVEVVWLTRQAIPAKLVRTHDGATYTIELKELRSAPDASWPMVGREQIDPYEWIDGADLGDREYDPFVRKVLAMDAGRFGGHAH